MINLPRAFSNSQTYLVPFLFYNYKPHSCKINISKHVWRHATCELLIDMSVFFFHCFGLQYSELQETHDGNIVGSYNQHHWSQTLPSSVDKITMWTFTSYQLKTAKIARVLICAGYLVREMCVQEGTHLNRKIIVCFSKVEFQSVLFSGNWAECAHKFRWNIAIRSER